MYISDTVKVQKVDQRERQYTYMKIDFNVNHFLIQSFNFNDQW